MKKFLLLAALAANISLSAQNVDAVINAREAERIERVLAADDMMGRRTGTPGIEKAAAFIADEFRKAGLQPVAGHSYLQEFTMVRPRVKEAKGEIDDRELDPKQFVIITSQTDFKANEKDGYEVASIAKGASLFARAQQIMGSGRNTIVYVDTSFTANFGRLGNLRRQLFKTDHSTIFVLGTYSPKEFTFKTEQEVEELKLANVVGVLPGKSKKNEYVIFSGHYDHIGVGRPENGDSIYNGANDDAAGITAVILLANYYKKLNNNERTLVFAAFTAEEVGGWGSQYFSRQYDPASVVAMFNIEMIGTESKWGRNSAFITGYDFTDMGRILQSNLQGTDFTFYPDPYPQQQLFYRSDNATLARLGVPAHTISTAKMENEPHYHKPSDHVETLDMENMAAIIRAIALSARSIVAGKDAPSRVKTEQLR